MLQTDSIITQQQQSVAGDTLMVQKHYSVTPAQVLNMLPRNATPEQQDSAIQAHFKPKEIHWSNRPDTLHLPGLPGQSAMTSPATQYEELSYFADNEYYAQINETDRFGIVGDPLPYTIGGDNFMTALLIGCFILTMLAVSKAGAYLLTLVKSFVFIQHGQTTTATITSGESRCMLLLSVETCLLLGISTFFYVNEYVTHSFILPQYLVIASFTAFFAVYFILKMLLASITNWTFFDKKNNEQWMQSFTFLVSVEAILLLPLVLVQAYFDFTARTMTITLLVVLLLVRIIAFYKTYLIFFRQKGRILQNILYLCMLELVPISILWGLLMNFSNYLKVIN